MKKFAVIAFVVIAAAGGGYFAFGDRIFGSSDTRSVSQGPQGPVPISGSVQNFTALDEPVPAPQITFETETGEVKSFADFEGELLLVNFWATFCGPCIRELPSIETLAEKYGDRGLTVALISQDTAGWEQINIFLDRLKIETPESFLDINKKLANELGVSSLPTTALIDAEGNILGAVFGPAEWDTPEAFELIEYYLNAPAAAG